MRTLRLAALAAAFTLTLVAAGHAATVCPTGWKIVASADPGNKGDNVLKGIAGQAGNDIWAVGQYAADSNPNILRTLIEHFDGTMWRVVPSPNVGAQANALVSVATAHGGLAWAAGYSIDPATFFGRALLEQWNGSAWSVATIPNPGAAAHLFAVAADAFDDVWAVGETEPRIGQQRTLILHYDGTQWSVVPSPNPGNAGNVLYGVVALASNDVWAAGQQSISPGPDRDLLLHWDGTAWHAQPPAPPSRSNLGLFALAHGIGGLVGGGEAQNDIAHKTLPLIDGGPDFIPLGDDGDLGRDDGHLYGVAVGPNGAVAVGTRVNYAGAGGGNDKTLILERPGANGSWMRVPSPDPIASGVNQLGGVASIQSTFWAVGDHDGPRALRTLIVRSCR